MRQILTIICFFVAIGSYADPNLLQKVIWFPEHATLKQVWNFNSDGLIYEIRDYQDQVIQDFTYDANNNLIQTNIIGSNTLTYSFTYDANNRITSMTYTNPSWTATTNIYFDEATNTYTSDPDVTDSEDNYFYWKMNADMLLLTEWYNYVDETPMTQEGITSGYFDGDMRYEYDSYMTSIHHWQYTFVTNPVRQSFLPVCKAMALVGFNESYTKKIRPEFVSQNIEIGWNGDSEDPESIIYVYELNSNELPYKRIRKDYYLGEFESAYTEMIYYYQGDVIP